MIIEPVTLTRTCILSVLRRELIGFDIIDMATTDGLGCAAGRDVRLVALSIGDKSVVDPSVEDDLTASQILASPMFLRVLEELSAYVAPGRARKALIESLDHAGIDPIEATSLDLREAVVDALPRLLDAMFTRDDLDLVLERLETALTHAIVPTRIPDPPRDPEAT